MDYLHYDANTNKMHTIEIVFIQGVSRLVDITAGGDLLGLCDQKSSYEGWNFNSGNYLFTTDTK